MLNEEDINKTNTWTGTNKHENKPLNPFGSSYSYTGRAQRHLKNSPATVILVRLLSLSPSERLACKDNLSNSDSFPLKARHTRHGKGTTNKATWHWWEDKKCILVNGIWHFKSARAEYTNP